MPNRSIVISSVISGVEAVPIAVECSIGEGAPDFQIIGLRRELADEMRAIVRCAIKSTGYEWPNRNVTVALTPLDMPKRGAHLALPIAAAVLEATGQICLRDDYVVVGEMSLSGCLAYPTRGIIAVRRLVQELHREMVCPSCDSMPAGYTHRALGINSLADLRTGSFERVGCIESGEKYDADKLEAELSDGARAVYDRIVDLVGDDGWYEGFKSVLIVAPHERTTYVPEALRAAVNPISGNMVLECAAIASVAGDGDIPSLLGYHRPIRMPDPSISLPALIGGGMPVRPGEISLAHNGVLYLDDLALWKPSTLRQVDAARRDGHVRIVRADGVTGMPAAFQLVGCIAPCPCGHYGDPDRDCTCEAQQVAAWQRRIEQMSAMFDTVIHL
ncbi:Competence protein ComM [Slackia heliotrinireducens]|uniref:Predicted ATPase with chaperone activity n=1 Tax=Slackia heliotrinireducens (strain ATCC 29202 / DSM 20476 / NCTC 11029 / RHS 1) TaxID=471855 RepID=C7N823_SLAHD|nr:ATP-binding protein [Slackia heliotrinireducens]ACV23058.1 predicted ATPase with chaperone activity [Slackia heliotrinireducens DSM 20476]VEH02007.1 Competence protein ComM [Slackia heliotrinireducens]